MIQFSKEFDYVYELNADGYQSATPLSLLTENEKRNIYEEKASEDYA